MSSLAEDSKPGSAAFPDTVHQSLVRNRVFGEYRRRCEAPASRGGQAHISGDRGATCWSDRVNELEENGARSAVSTKHNSAGAKRRPLAAAGVSERRRGGACRRGSGAVARDEASGRARIRASRSPVRRQAHIPGDRGATCWSGREDSNLRPLGPERNGGGTA